MALVCVASWQIRAQSTRLSWLVGSASEAQGKTYLWNHLEGERWLSRDRFFVRADLQSRSLLSASRAWGGGAGVGVALELGGGFEWLPELAIEKDAFENIAEGMIRNSARYRLWSASLQTQVSFAPFPSQGTRGFGLRQSVGMKLGEGISREDILSIDFEFRDRVSSDDKAAGQGTVRRVGVAFASQIEF